MTSDDVTKEHCKQIQDALGPAMDYLTALWDRVCKQGMASDEKIGQPIYRAYSELHGLMVALHYHACDQSRKENPPPVIWGQRKKD